MFRSEAIGKTAEDNLKGIRPRNGKIILFPSMPNTAFWLVSEEFTLTVPQFPVLQTYIIFNIWPSKIWSLSHLE